MAIFFSEGKKVKSPIDRQRGKEREVRGVKRASRRGAGGNEKGGIDPLGHAAALEIHIVFGENHEQCCLPRRGGSSIGRGNLERQMGGLLGPQSPC